MRHGFLGSIKSGDTFGFLHPAERSRPLDLVKSADTRRINAKENRLKKYMLFIQKTSCDFWCYLKVSLLLFKVGTKTYVVRAQ